MRIALFLLLLMVVWLVGCSPTRQIAVSATEVGQLSGQIGQLAQSIESDLQSTNSLLIELPVSDQLSSDSIQLAMTSIDAAIEKSEEIVGLSSGIQVEVAKVHSAVTQTKDVQNQWVTLGLYIAGAVICVCVVFVLWRTGVFALIGGLVGLFKPSRSSGILAAKSVFRKTASPEDKERIAIQRVADPVFDRAYKAESKKQKEKK